MSARVFETIADTDFVDKANMNNDSGKTETPEVHIAGIVVHADRAQIESIRKTISMLPGALIHAISPAGKLVVTLEASRSVTVLGQLQTIHALPGVHSAALIYQHHEDADTLDEEIRDDTDPAGVH